MSAAASDWDVLRRYLGPNLDSYSATGDTLSMIDGSYERRVLHSEAVAALDRLEAEHRADHRALPSGEKKPRPRPDFDPHVDYPERYADGRPI